MSQKNEEIKAAAESQAEATVTEAEKSPAQAAPKQKKAAKKPKKPNIFVRIGRFFGRKFKEIFSELKKVTWPTFPTVLKQTGVVLVVVLFFLVIVFAFDSLLSMAYTLLK